MLGIRQKLSLGFGGLLALIVIIGLESVSLLSELGGSIDVILRENYRSVIASQEMKEALERMDSGILFTLLGYQKEGLDLITENKTVFLKAMKSELENITIPGEQEKAIHIQSLFNQYEETIESVTQSELPHKVRMEAYFQKVLPLFQSIKTTADEILNMNQQNMSDANQEARVKSQAARQRMSILLVVGVLLAVLFMLLTEKWILRPLAGLTLSAQEIKSGNLDLYILSRSRDEIGTLAQAFNEMAAGLRESRRVDRANWSHMKRSTELAFKVLPEAVAIVDKEGVIQIVSDTASEVFGMLPMEKINNPIFRGMVELFNEAISTGRPAELNKEQYLIQRFVNGKEFYFRPKVVPVLDNYRHPTGVIILLTDVTLEREQNEIKRGVVSTVSHQLKTPLTSIRMSLHLLLEEKLGPLSEKQLELLIAAREESDRLHTILERLLNISRIESGKTNMELKSVRPHELVFESIEPFRSAAVDRGLTLEIQLPNDLPEVSADPVMVSQVFANLVSNALKYTGPGGLIRAIAQTTDDFVQFSVSDTGRGIPAQYLEKILQHFFRVPGQTTESGLGLGLSIVQEIVEAHGGTISVESVESEGSVFTFTLRRSDRISEEEAKYD
jgi:signal transduction histidine kinase/HAMP domain-containing protein